MLMFWIRIHFNYNLVAGSALGSRWIWMRIQGLKIQEEIKKITLEKPKMIWHCQVI